MYCFVKEFNSKPMFIVAAPVHQTIVNLIYVFLFQCMQMDRSWINSRIFSKQHMAGVSEFMKFVSERFTESEEILCPCRRCLNQLAGHKSLVEDHLYIYGMASTYTTWIHHGEALLNARIEENANHLDEEFV